ncbi:MAG TPA: dihydroorotate dehydrogenase-like protein [Candidatus Acidoferrales bacterium]|nr:dihydroorotate dehydrogenase-like protein [Candidatus Acidoferrales bacterium]
MIDLKTKYLGLQLKNPIVPSASPLSKNLDSMKRLEDAGASAIVMYSLFEEEIAHESAELDHYLHYGTESYPEALTYMPSAAEYNLEPDAYVDLLRKAKESLGIPVIPSLNGITPGGWIKYAKHFEDAGADAIELNVYYIATDERLTSLDIEERYIDVLSEVKEAVKIPVAVKLSPYFSSLPNLAARLVKAGADGLVFFNRFYQPDINLDELEVIPGVALSDSTASRLPMRWIAIFYGKLKVDLAASSGIHTAEDVIKTVMVGADITMMCSALLQNGAGHIAKILADMTLWFEEHEYESVAQMKGSMSQKSVADPGAFERANYIKALNRFKLLI